MAELTAEERAKRIIVSYRSLKALPEPVKIALGVDIVAQIREAETDARQKERERCAELAQHWEDLAPNIADVSHQIAAAIRAQTLDRALSRIVIKLNARKERRGGSLAEGPEIISTCKHEAWMDKRTGRIMLTNNEDGYYVQVFETPEEFNQFIQMLIRILGEKRRTGVVAT